MTAAGAGPRRAVLAAGVVLLAGPTAIGFFAGGYFVIPRLWAGIVVWALIAVGAFAGRPMLPSRRAGRIAVGGLALMTAWTAASIAWAPQAGPATESTERMLLYLGTLVLATSLLRDSRLARATEPALLGGAVVILGYGLAERVLPGIVSLQHSASSFGRLEQPISYWNAEGALAAIGLVLAARVAGDERRPTWLAAAAAAAAAPLGAGVFLTVSRGALAVTLGGLIAVTAMQPTRSQLRAAVLVLGTAILVCVVVAPLGAVVTLKGAMSTRETEGLAYLAVLLVAAGGAAAAVLRLRAREAEGRLATGRLGAARRLPVIAAVGLTLLLAAIVVDGLRERGAPSKLPTRGTARLTRASTRRYDYWRVAVHEIGQEPLRGIGAAGFRVVWLEQRHIKEGVLEVHSLELEAAMELGLPGALGLVLLVAGVALAARRDLRRNAAGAAGAAAACLVFLLHASIDWDWQIPAVTGVALILAGSILAAADTPDQPRRLVS